MEQASTFDLSAALKSYNDDPNTISTPDAQGVLWDCEHDPDTLNAGTVNEVLNPILDDLVESPDAIAKACNLDSVLFLLKHAAYISPLSLHKLVDVITTGLVAAADSAHGDLEAEEQDLLQIHKRTLEMYGFLIQWAITALDTKSSQERKSVSVAGRKNLKGAKSKPNLKDSACDPSSQILAAFDAMAKVMKLKLSRIFVVTSERDTFISLFTRAVYLILENEANVKHTGIRMHSFRVLCVAVKHHGHAAGAQTAIDQCLSYYEHLSEPMAEFLNILSDQYDFPQLAEEVLKELSNKEFNNNDLKGPRSVSTFIARLSELAPRLVIRQVMLLAKLLDSESYTLRCAIIEVCGNLIAMLSKEEDAERSENHKMQMDAFFDVLEERFLDINPYCRCRAIQVYTKLCELETKYPKRRQRAAELATRSLEDKSSNVRRNAIKLLGKLVSTHPFSVLHGGQLSQSEWNNRLSLCEAEIESLSPSTSANTVTRDENTIDEDLLDDATETSPAKARSTVIPPEEHAQALVEETAREAANVEMLSKLSLTRRYYVEALNFILVIHEASDIAIQLLGSKNKSEVIETMDFFVIADAYKIESARTGIRRMLRLIWTKGNSDEGKGVQTHLVECYKGLFFDAPDSFSANDAANFVARNMISLTFGATSAELTSLEQLVSTMMTGGMISDTVVQKLWQVYGVQRKEISKTQRRGAIIILGMLATAQPQIIVKEMETCLRVGLGSLGRADLGLARYTCIALNRMTGSKHLKGAVVVPDARLENSHPVLQELASIIRVQSTSKEWFGLAEQAITAIYSLSQHPDDLCSQILKEKASTIFSHKSTGPVENPSGDIDKMDVDEDGEGASDSAKRCQSVEHSKDATIGLSQLLFAVGHVAIKQIVHLELCEQDFKRRKAEKEKNDQPQNTSPIDKKNSKRSKTTTTATDEAKDEMDLIAGTNEDDFTEAIQHVRERELLYGEQSLMATFGPLVREICINNTAYPNKDLQAQAALCMSKMMCVSAEYCEQNLALLITILERSHDATARSNLVVALGDMAVCFNHLIDENTDYLYRRLSDSSLSVKRTCLMTLTFLILAGQVKVKGQLGEMAKCVEDEDERLREMSRMFFGELASKDNAIYNHYIDMFSLLSADSSLEEDQFKKIIKFLSAFIEKDKHAKQLASKLAARLQRAQTERQWNDVTYALGLLQHKDEDISKVIGEGFKTVQTAA